MKPTPPGWPRASVSVWYEDPARAIDWLCEAFGFEVRLKVEGDGGKIVHSEVTYGEAVFMIGDSGKGADGSKMKVRRAAPREVDGRNTMNVLVYVDDVDAHCAHARANGATIAVEPAISDYGDDYWTDKGYECVDLEGHHWWFYERLKTGANKGGTVKHEPETA
jgi:uncharacterized glyoxalase superfamily protein PhnB